MSLHLILDAAWPPAGLPAGVEGVAGYIGGPRADRAWTLAEWLRFADSRQWPVYVPDDTADPDAQAAELVALMRKLGWAPGLEGPDARAVLVDLETVQDREWYARAAAKVLAGGYVPVGYGSLSTVLENAASDIVVAAWDHNRAIPAGQTIHGHQYAANTPYGGTLVDLSTVDDWMFRRGGVGPRHG